MNIEREKELQSQIEQLRSELEGWYEWAANTYQYVKDVKKDPHQLDLEKYDRMCAKLETDLRPYCWTVHNNEEEDQ